MQILDHVTEKAGYSGEEQKEKMNQMVSWILHHRLGENMSIMGRLGDKRLTHRDDWVFKKVLNDLNMSERHVIDKCINTFGQLPAELQISNVQIKSEL